MKVFIALLLLLSLALSSTFEELQKKLAGVKTVKVLFIQKTHYSWYPKPELSKGVFYAASDGRFRIDYTYPDDVVIVSDGAEIIIYNREEKEALIDSVKNNTSPVIESLFFFSRPLSDVFELAGEIKREGRIVLILKPKKEDENIREVYVELGSDLEIRSVEVVDKEDTRTLIEFIEVRKNYLPSQDLFRITLPSGVRVRRAESLR